MARIVTMLKIGVWRQQNKLDAVWFQQQEAKYLSINMNDIETLQAQIAQRLAVEQVKKLPFAFISAISPHQIWSKSLVLPQVLSPYETEQQCRFVLEQELPVSVKDLWFDYRTDISKQGFHLEIFAIQKVVALAHTASLSPLKIQVLDNVVHAIIRAFEYVLKRGMSGGNMLIYQEDERVFLIRPKAFQNQVLQHSSEDLTALYQQFCERNDFQPENVFVYRTGVPLVPLDPSWQEIKTELPLVALGNALWQKDPQLTV